MHTNFQDQSSKHVDALKFIVLKISYYTVNACPYTRTVCYYTSSYHIVPYSYTYFIVTHCTFKQCHIGTNIAMWPCVYCSYRVASFVFRHAEVLQVL